MSRATPCNRKICIGIDLDNTIIDYSRLVVTLARDQGLVPPEWTGGKEAVRAVIRMRGDEGEQAWQRVQAEMYGARILEALPYDGVGAFLSRCLAADIPLAIISHKSERAAADPDGCDLRAAARDWLLHNGIVGSGSVPAQNVYFADSRAEKLSMITAFGCTIFIDDLVEVLLDPGFPPGISRWYFTGGAPAKSSISPLLPHATWQGLLASLEREIGTS